MKLRTALLATAVTSGTTALGMRLWRALSGEIFGQPEESWPRQRNTHEPELFGPTHQCGQEVHRINGGTAVVSNPDGTLKVVKLGLRRLIRGI